MEFSKSCWGCQTNQLGQLPHMDPGGCLYDAQFDGLFPDDGYDSEATTLTRVSVEAERKAKPVTILSSLETVKSGRFRKKTSRFGWGE